MVSLYTSVVFLPWETACSESFLPFDANTICAANSANSLPMGWAGAGAACPPGRASLADLRPGQDLGRGRGMGAGSCSSRLPPSPSSASCWLVPSSVLTFVLAMLRSVSSDSACVRAALMCVRAALMRTARSDSSRSSCAVVGWFLSSSLLVPACASLSLGVVNVF